MHKRTYSIRAGFEYQDLYSAVKILELIEAREYATQFQLESDEVHHVDDLVIYPPDRAPTAYQIKFHVDQAHADSFASLAKRPTAESKSLLEKLHTGWRELTKDGEAPGTVIFVSSNPGAREKYDLASAIDTANGKLNAAVFSASDFASKTHLWAQRLSLPLDAVQRFAENLVFTLGRYSRDDLNQEVAHLLERLRLPHDKDAVTLLTSLVGYFATDVQGRTTPQHFIQKLAEYPHFREACEQQFSELLAKSAEPASALRVAAVCLEYLPAYVGSDCACLEEPIPLTEYRSNGLTRPGLADVLQDARARWSSDYLSWQRRRILGILQAMIPVKPDVLVFPRFALPLDLLPDVVAWSQANECNVVVGGHSLVLTTDALSRYHRDLTICLDGHLPDNVLKQAPDLVIDAVIRFDRASRFTLSRCTGPYAKTEDIYTPARLCMLRTRRGLVSCVLIPSASALDDLLRGQKETPELIVCATTLHADVIGAKLAAAPPLHNTPAVICGMPTIKRPRIFVLGAKDPPVSQANEWEGIVVADFTYQRSAAQRWHAEVVVSEQIPIVYAASSPDPTASTKSIWRGKPGSRIDATRASRTSNCPVILDAPDPDSFFVARARYAEELLRQRLAAMTTEQITECTGSLEALSEFLREHAGVAIALPHVPAIFSQDAKTPAFVDRATELNDLSRFVEGSGHEVLLLLYGPPGIGKRAILADVQRKDPARDKWIWFRCVPDSPLPEVLGHMLVRFGSTCPEQVELSPGTYSSVVDALHATGACVLVLEDAQHLPLSQDAKYHADLLAFLSTLSQRTGPGQPRLILLSEWKGHLQFSYRHKLNEVHIGSLDDPYVVQLLRELLTRRPPQGAPPTAADLERLAIKLHGHPKLAEIAAALLEHNSTDDIVRTLYSRQEVRQFVLNRLLGKTTLSRVEREVMSLAAVFRISVDQRAFTPVAGAQSRVILQELADRFLVEQDRSRVMLHPLLAEHFRSELSPDELRRLHETAFRYFSGLYRTGSITFDGRLEHVYHAVHCGQHLDSDAYKHATGPVRTSMIEALRDREWERVLQCTDTLLGIWTSDSVARVARAVALDATGRYDQAQQYVDSVTDLDRSNLWVAIELARSRIRRRDFNSAEGILTEVEQRFGSDGRIQVAWAQLFETKGLIDEAVERCSAVLANPSRYYREAFYASLILRHANKLDVLVRLIEEHWKEPVSHPGLFRVYAYGCVVTGYAPSEGLSDLHDLWRGNPNDGRALADYATALAHVGRTQDAENLFKKGVTLRGPRRDGRLAVMEEYALFLSQRGRYSEAHAMFREVLRARQHDLHVYRRFAKSLMRNAAAAKAHRDMPGESACNDEAVRVLKKLLEIAPEDRWAQDELYRAERHNYID
jgi:tetratricopeptide (TPR) repeat protein